MTDWYEQPYPKGPAVGPSKLPRVLVPRKLQADDPHLLRGPDVTAFKRAISRAQRWRPWDPQEWDNAYWDAFALGRGGGAVSDSGVRGFQRQEWRGSPGKQTGILNDETYQRIRRCEIPDGPNKGAPLLDPVAIRLLQQAADEFQEVPYCYPHSAQANSSICQGLHETAGLWGNWALDFCAPGGTAVFAVEAAKITKLSGSDPSHGADQETGIFGWSIHYETKAGYRYFSTHYGSRSCQPGQSVRVGQQIGKVGSWPGDPGRSHTHLGVTSPHGEADAKRRIQQIGSASRL